MAELQCTAKQNGGDAGLREHLEGNRSHDQPAQFDDQKSRRPCAGAQLGQRVRKVGETDRVEAALD